MKVDKVERKYAVRYFFSKKRMLHKIDNIENVKIG